LTGVIIHFGVNAIVFSAGLYPRLNAFLGMQDEQIVDWSRLAGFAAILVVGLFLLRKSEPSPKA
jgi:hypothetical protein